VLSFTAPEGITARPWREDYAIRGFSSNEAANWAKWFPGQKPGWVGEYRDDDNSGLPNWFEHYYFGQWTGVDPQADPDGDGKTNAQELQAGTDPRTPPAVYPAGFRWDNAADFKPDNATYPWLDAQGGPAWLVEFRPQGAPPTAFKTAGLLVKQIPAWLERGNSWSFGLGRPQDGTLSFFGEGDSATSQVWLAPVSGAVVLEVRAAAEANSTPVQVALTAPGGEELWAVRLAPGDPPQNVRHELTVTRGAGYRLVVRAADAQGKWAARVAWTMTCLQALPAQ
jgi:hypothetical protein